MIHEQTRRGEGHFEIHHLLRFVNRNFVLAEWISRSRNGMWKVEGTCKVPPAARAVVQLSSGLESVPMGLHSPCFREFRVQAQRRRLDNGAPGASILEALSLRFWGGPQRKMLFCATSVLRAPQAPSKPSFPISSERPTRERPMVTCPSRPMMTRR